jgi:hypothetical protein
MTTASVNRARRLSTVALRKLAGAGPDVLKPLCSSAWPPENFANNEENAVSDLPLRPEGRP